jgi:hypothetical protein
MEPGRAAGSRREERDVEQALGDLAARFGLSRRTLNQAALRGHLPARRVGYQWLSTPAAVDAYLKGARHRPGRTPQRRPPAAPTPEPQVLAEPVA